MQNSTYNQLAALTLSDKFFCTTTDDQHLLHAAIGIQTEVGELFSAVLLGEEAFYKFDRTNFLEEIGDAAWYLSIPQRIFNFEVDLPFDYEQKSRESKFVDLLNELNTDTTDFLDIMKKKIFYGREFHTEDLLVLLNSIYGGLRALTTLVNGNWDTVLKNNIDKLAARYNGAFSEFLANNRDLATEYKILARS